MNGTHDLHIVGEAVDAPTCLVLSCPDCPIVLIVSASTPEGTQEIAVLAALWHEGRVLAAREEISA